MDTIVTPQPSVDLGTAREGYIGSIKGEGLKLREYANAMNAAFSVLDANGKVVKPWYELKGKAASGVKAEFNAFSAALKAAGYADGVEYTYWGRVKDASGRVKPGNRVQASETDDLALSRDDIKRVLNRTNKLRQAGGHAFERLEEVYEELQNIYATLGGDPEKDLK